MTYRIDLHAPTSASPDGLSSLEELTAAAQRMVDGAATGLFSQGRPA